MFLPLGPLLDPRPDDVDLAGSQRPAVGGRGHFDFGIVADETTEELAVVGFAGFDQAERETLSALLKRAWLNVISSRAGCTEAATEEHP